MLRKEKGAKGITLIALVITIVILLILAGVAIAALTGDNGILKRASESKEKTVISQKTEEVKVALMEVITENNGERDKVTVSKTLEAIRKNYGNQKDKDAIIGEALGDEEDKFPGAITYQKRVSKLSKDVVITVDSNLNVTGYTEDSGKDDNKGDDTPKYDIPESEYTKTGNLYYYEPDLSGFNPEATYYVTYDENGNNETIYGRIDKVEKPTTGWHNYENKIWGNVVTVTESDVTYWTWVPRYKYNAGSSSAEAYFVDLNDKCTMSTDSGDREVDVSSCELSEGFKFADKKLKGYWVSKYEVQFSETNGLEQLKTKSLEQAIQVGTTNPSGLYTIYLDGVKYKEHQSLDTEYKIDNLKATKIYDVCIYSETNNRMVGRERKMAKSVINVDTSGFDKEKTYYVTYDNNGKETIAGRMDKISAPVNWYNYEEKIWANLVTVNENNVTYWTYVPRYEYNEDEELYEKYNIAKVRFISTLQTTADYGYVIPESFTFNEKVLPGYWMSKYEVQFSEKSDLEEVKLTVANSEYEVTTTKPSGTYTIYVNGEKSKTGISLPYKIKNLDNNKENEICLYSEENNRMVGAMKTTDLPVNIIKVDLSGFNPDCTYYVTYDDQGNNEQIGEKIKLDSKGNATNMPNNWYDYENKKWANIVTKGTDASGNELISYWTYVPRYEYNEDEELYEKYNIAKVKFIPTSKTTADYGYVIPESFTFAGKQLAGYWMSKYEVQGTID